MRRAPQKQSQQKITENASQVAAECDGPAEENGRASNSRERVHHKCHERELEAGGRKMTYRQLLVALGLEQPSAAETRRAANQKEVARHEDRERELEGEAEWQLVAMKAGIDREQVTFDMWNEAVCRFTAADLAWVEERTALLRAEREKSSAGWAA